MKTELSILIPVYNYDCTALATGLLRELEQLRTAGVQSELIIAEDGSADEACLRANSRLAPMPGLRYIRREHNVGRAAIRNFLARQSQYRWLLFLDCDMQLPGDRFLRTYLESEGEEVVDGGFAVRANKPLMGRNLRYTYEWSEQRRHAVAQRQANPYRSFRTTNFMVRRDIMMSHPFDERFLHYGYEDVLFGKGLRQGGITISHIDNPMVLTDVEANDVFMAKTEEALRTLHEFRNDLRGYSRLLTFAEGIHLRGVTWCIKLWHRLFGTLERRMLLGNHPGMRLFKLYKIGYYISLTNNDKRQHL